MSAGEFFGGYVGDSGYIVYGFLLLLCLDNAGIFPSYPLVDKLYTVYTIVIKYEY